MNNNVSFEYYSTFAPVSDHFAADCPRHKKVEVETDVLPPQLFQNSYIIHSRITYKPLLSIRSHYFK